MASSLNTFLQSTVYTPATGNRRRSGAEAGSSELFCRRKRDRGPRLCSSALMAKLRSSEDVIEGEGKVMVQTYGRAPVVVVRGKGCMVYDCEGREYLDMTAGIAVNVLGHSDPEWSAAVADQAVVLTHVSNNFYSLPQVELAERLVASSFADRVFFSNSGTEANEAAIKFSRKFQRFSRPNDKSPPAEFIAFTNSFHGRTMGALALTSKVQYREPFEPLMAGVTFLEYGNGEAVRKVMQSGNVAAVFVEPVQGEGGIHAATREFLQSLRNACDNSGALLVFDEVQCGLGRTGFLWAHEEYGILPDMMTIAKPLAGGLPIGAVLLTERVAAAIARGDHGSTFAGGPLVCKAALSVLDKVSDKAFLSDVARKGRYLKDALKEKLRGKGHVEEVRGKGLLIGVQLDVPASPFVDRCRDSGMLVLTAGKGDVLRLLPPLVVSFVELELAVGIIEAALR